jgi:hypothetical protein
MVPSPLPAIRNREQAVGKSVRSDPRCSVNTVHILFLNQRLTPSLCSDQTRYFWTVRVSSKSLTSLVHGTSAIMMFSILQII